MKIHSIRSLTYAEVFSHQKAMRKAKLKIEYIIVSRLLPIKFMICSY